MHIILRITTVLSAIGISYAAGFVQDVFSSPYLPTPAAPEIKEAPAEEGTPFAEVVADCDTLAGLFTLYHKEKTGECWMEVAPDQLNRDLLISTTLEQGLGFAGLVAGLPLENIVARLVKRHEHIDLLVPYPYAVVADGSPLAAAVDRSTTDSVIWSWDLESAPEPERGSYLIKLDDWALDEHNRFSGKMGERLRTSVHPLRDRCDYSLLKSFAENVEIGARLVYETSFPRYEWGSTLELELRYSLSFLPESNYVARWQDERVGYFLGLQRVWGDGQRENPFNYFIERWHLEKKHPDAALSEPVKPIVFWLENTVPYEYRDVLRDGILAWNKAFEQAGFLNAVEVRQQPDDADWDPADIRYNTIRWITSRDIDFVAMGPSQSNPYTGEILNADVLVEGDVVRQLQQMWQEAIQPLALGGSQQEPLHTPDRLLKRLEQEWSLTTDSPELEPLRERRQQEMQSMQRAGLATLDASARANGMPLNVEERDAFVRQYLRFMVMHEVGHTFGLRHNFFGSRMLAFEQLGDTSLTHECGMIASVMDYVKVALMADPQQQGDYFPQVTGPYDRWAIEWGYTPFGASEPQEEREALNRIAARSTTDPALRYATDDDSWDFIGSAVDPAARQMDMSCDDAALLRNRRALLQKVLSADPASMLQPGEDPGHYRDMVMAAADSYWYDVEGLTLYGGALHLRREPFGQGVVPAQPYTAEEIRPMIALLLEYTFDQKLWSLSERQWELMGPNWNWNLKYHDRHFHHIPDFDNYLLSKRMEILAACYAPLRLQRIVDLNSRGSVAYTLDEHFTAIFDRIWKECPRDTGFRGLQLSHISMMQLLMFDSALAPSDARTMARASLVSARTRLLSWKQRNGLDRMTRAHIDECITRIEAALERDLDRL